MERVTDVVEMEENPKAEVDQYDALKSAAAAAESSAGNDAAESTQQSLCGTCVGVYGTNDDSNKKLKSPVGVVLLTEWVLAILW